jgi:hypothetical protein
MKNSRLERKAISLSDDINSVIIDLINEVDSKESEIELLNQRIAELVEKYTDLDNIIWDLKHP